MRRPTYVYIAEVPGGMLKIGLSENPRTRVMGLQGRILGLSSGDLGDEARLHEQFRSFLVSGREWYSDCPEIRGFARTMERDTLPLPNDLMLRRRSGLGSWPSVRASEARWEHILRFLSFQASELERAIATAAGIEAEVERVRPLMEADPTLTYGEACARLAEGAAA